jgi:hypothetical protein
MIAAISAVILFIVMFFKWFGYDFGGDVAGLAASAGVDVPSVSANAWQSFGFIDIVLFVTVIVAIGAAVMKANSQSVNTPVAISAITAGLGILCVVLVLFRIIDPPGDSDRKIGVFLGFLATIGVAYGGYLSMQEEGTSFQSQADRLQNRGGGSGGAPPPPPPAAPPAPPRDPGSNPPPAV